MKATVADIIAATSGSLVKGAPSTPVGAIFTDTRSERFADSAFIAIKGERYDGHSFAAEAIGATCIIVSSLNDAIKNAKTAVILVPDTLVALGDIAHWWRNRLTIPIIGITGSAGKTTTKEMLATICRSSKRVSKNKGNFNNRIGLPLSLLATKENDEIGIFEMGSNSLGEIAILTKIARPTLGLITNIGSAHIGNFGSAKAIYEEKSALFVGIGEGGSIAINNDDPALKGFAAKSMGITFGMREASDVMAMNAHQREEEIVFDLTIKGKMARCRLPIIGAHNIMNALGASALASLLGFEVAEIAAGLATYQAANHRLNKIKLLNSAFILDDTYNASPESMKRALEALCDKTGGERFAILGDMKELGEKSRELHHDIGFYAASLGISRLFLRGEFARDYFAGALSGGMDESQIAVHNSSEAIARAAYSAVTSGDGILVKGSRSANMDEVVDLLVKIDATRRSQ
ncbi:MAG: UDP-N-acetylmuramoyl-tripeptide--D-alanyl-D-alanine ligase [Deltaproteobacteria bacterium]|nr:UDP-N-acetylmuramoyl-tripeptide--D-alanyl-D-alanine ligase [Deltaproteobacteria bacterium]